MSNVYKKLTFVSYYMPCAGDAKILRTLHHMVSNRFIVRPTAHL